VVRVYDSDGKLLHIRDFTSTSEAENTEHPQESSMCTASPTMDTSHHDSISMDQTTAPDETLEVFHDMDRTTTQKKVNISTCTEVHITNENDDPNTETQLREQPPAKRQKMNEPEYNFKQKLLSV